MESLKKIFIHPKNLIFVYVITAAIVLSSAIIELNQSKDEMMEMMEKQGHSILETVLKSSHNAILSYNKFENEIKHRLLNNAVVIRMLYDKGMVNNSLLKQLAKLNNIYRINIFDKHANKIYSSHKDIHKREKEKESPLKYIKPIFTGEEDTLIIGVKKARFLDEQRFAVALATRDRNAIVLNINADELISFRKELGFGVLLKKVTENPQIVYAVLQDNNGFIAGSGKFDELDDIEEDPILVNSMKDSLYNWRILKVGSNKVFELLHPFYHNGKTIGLFRLGLSMEPLNTINERLTRRIIIIAILLFVFGSVTLTLVFLRKNFNVLTNRYSAMESYSTRIVNNVSDGILVLDELKRIKLFNKAAEKIFGAEENELKGKLFTELIKEKYFFETFSNLNDIQEYELNINGKNRSLLFSISKFSDENNNENTILVIRDLTEIKQLERQSIRNEKMIAMGKLSSAVAHEIRNPLNSIGTIAQQIGKDFEVKENSEDFKSLTRLVYKEVRRINDTIEMFLRFSKSQPINATSFSLNNFLDEIKAQYESHLKEKNINLEIENSIIENVTWDYNQIKQVFINLIENSIDAQPNGGRISIKMSPDESRKIKIVFEDKGIGIKPDILKQIFDLYFTTKPNGNGIGLSIVHKIITEHGGSIKAESCLNEGTTFTIFLPQKYS